MNDPDMSHFKCAHKQKCESKRPGVKSFGVCGLLLLKYFHFYHGVVIYQKCHLSFLVLQNLMGFYPPCWFHWSISPGLFPSQLKIYMLNKWSSCGNLWTASLHRTNLKDHSHHLHRIPNFLMKHIFIQKYLIL